MHLRDYWKKAEVPAIKGITFSDGSVLVNENCKPQPSYNFLNSTLAEYEKKYSDLGVEVEVYAQRFVDDLGAIFCGACEMGNEGFIVCEGVNSAIKWSIYQDFANPFLNNIEVVNGVIRVTTELQYFWEIPLSSPEKMSCVSKNEWGY